MAIKFFFWSWWGLVTQMWSFVKIHPSQHFLFIYFFVYLFTLKGKLIKIIPMGGGGEKMTILEKSQQVMACLVPLTIVMITNVLGSVGENKCECWLGSYKSILKKIKITNEENLVTRLYQWNCPQGPISWGKYELIIDRCKCQWKYNGVSVLKLGIFFG